MSIAQRAKYRKLLGERIADLLALGVEMADGPLDTASTRPHRRRLEFIAEVAIAETQVIRRQIALQQAAQALCDFDRANRYLPLCTMNVLTQAERAAYRQQADIAITTYLESQAGRLHQPHFAADGTAPRTTLLQADVIG